MGVMNSMRKIAAEDNVHSPLILPLMFMCQNEGVNLSKSFTA